MTIFKNYFIGLLNFLLKFTGGFALALLYCVCLLKNIPICHELRKILFLLSSTIFGVGTAVSTQLRCISLLTLLTYCGKPGRGVIKAVLLTYVVAGPIANMGLNAKEVVRVFSCSAEMSYNISKEKYSLISDPIWMTAIHLQAETNQVVDTFRYFRNVLPLLEREVEEFGGNQQMFENNDYIYEMYQSINGIYFHDDQNKRAKEIIERNDTYLRNYLNKLRRRCENQVYYSQMRCTEMLSSAYSDCHNALPSPATWMICQPLKSPKACTLVNFSPGICNYKNQIDPGFGEGYAALKKIKLLLSEVSEPIEIGLQYDQKDELYDIQDAKETSARVTHAFEEKTSIMRSAFTIMDVCIALLFLRIFHAAVVYHDMYLTSIDFDNVYITTYFKRLDARRRKKGKIKLLPLKKMERNRYIDSHSVAYTAERSRLFTQILKVMLEMITATTFVMLDRLFYEALDVVRQHAESDTKQGMQCLDIEVEGTGVLASLMRKLLHNLNTQSVQRTFSNEPCIPRPRLMPCIFFIKIYGGYLWILVLLYLNPYTFRLRRFVCSYFYPRREKQRILHLYNDILKKRMKLHKILRRKAVQAVRAYYLSGENILTLRMRFPNLLGWLRIFPTARMSCLICDETEPRKEKSFEENWHTCSVDSCPFVYCAECWIEIGEQCLACDPSLAELSDIDSLSEDELPRN